MKIILIVCISLSLFLNPFDAIAQEEGPVDPRTECLSKNWGGTYSNSETPYVAIENDSDAKNPPFSVNSVNAQEDYTEQNFYLGVSSECKEFYNAKGLIIDHMGGDQLLKQCYLARELKVPYGCFDGDYKPFSKAVCQFYNLNPSYVPPDLRGKVNSLKASLTTYHFSTRRDDYRKELVRIQALSYHCLPEEEKGVHNKITWFNRAQLWLGLVGGVVSLKNGLPNGGQVILMEASREKIAPLARVSQSSPQLNDAIGKLPQTATANFVEAYNRIASAANRVISELTDAIASLTEQSKILATEVQRIERELVRARNAFNARNGTQPPTEIQNLKYELINAQAEWLKNNQKRNAMTALREKEKNTLAQNRANLIGDMTDDQIALATQQAILSEERKKIISIVTADSQETAKTLQGSLGKTTGVEAFRINFQESLSRFRQAVQKHFSLIKDTNIEMNTTYKFRVAVRSKPGGKGDVGEIVAVGEPIPTNISPHAGPYSQPRLDGDLVVPIYHKHSYPGPAYKERYNTLVLDDELDEFIVTGKIIFHEGERVIAIQGVSSPAIPFHNPLNPIIIDTISADTVGSKITLPFKP